MLETLAYHNIHQQVIDKCMMGNRQAQYDLYKLYAKSMLHTAYKITQDKAESEDAVQEAFLNIFKNIHLYKGESSFGSWAKKIVINQALTALRKRKMSFEDVGPIGELLEETIDDSSDEQHYKVESVKKAIQELPEGYRVIITLYLLEGYDHAEIAEYLNISESTSKSQYLRAKERLKKILKPMSLS